ncbi:hypothetical protein SB690_19935, partial [Bacillus sp. SIMBA_006]|uniref:hypothetical protein n=1 Tax=Bacillus sp. SIMBA_006 TaxID=3085755 RepID=UPI00397A8785
RDAYWESERKYNSLMDYLYSGEASVPTLILSPSGPDELPHNIETNPKIINEKGEKAYELAKTQLATIFPKAIP